RPARDRHHRSARRRSGAEAARDPLQVQQGRHHRGEARRSRGRADGLPLREMSRTIAIAAALTLAAAARADTVNFDLNGHLYTKYMYQNDNTQGCLSISNPFWVDNIGGHNGACSEFELNIKARVSDKVSAGVRLQSRWGALWQD